MATTQRESKMNRFRLRSPSNNSSNMTTHHEPVSGSTKALRLRLKDKAMSMRALFTKCDSAPPKNTQPIIPKKRRAGKRPQNNSCDTSRPSFVRSQSQPAFCASLHETLPQKPRLSRDNSRRLVIESFDSFNSSQRSILSNNSSVVSPRKPARRKSVDKESECIIQGFETFDQSQRTITVNASMSPRKPARRLSVDDSVQSIIMAHSPRVAATTAAAASPRKPSRRLSVDDGSTNKIQYTDRETSKPIKRVVSNTSVPQIPVLESLELCHNVEYSQSFNSDAPRKPARRLTQDGYCPVLECFHSFNHSQQSLGCESVAPRKPARRLSTDDGGPTTTPVLLHCFEAFNNSTRSLASSSNNNISEAPRRPQRRLSRDGSAPTLMTGTLTTKSKSKSKSKPNNQHRPVRALLREESAPAIFYHGSTKPVVGSRRELLVKTTSKRGMPSVAAMHQSQRSLLSISESCGPRKPQRTISGDDSKSVLMIHSSQQSLMSLGESLSSGPRLPRRSVSGDTGDGITLVMQGKTSTTSLLGASSPNSPQKPTRTSSEDSMESCTLPKVIYTWATDDLPGRIESSGSCSSASSSPMQTTDDLLHLHESQDHLDSGFFFI